MPKILIAGCGFVGLATARLFHTHSWEVIGCTLSAESATQLAAEPFPIVACDVAERTTTLSELTRHGPFSAIVHCASSGRGGLDAYQRVYHDGVRNLLEAFAPAHVVFTSSTSVYAQTTGEWVTEQSLAEPQRDTGRVLRAAEDLVLSSGGSVARLAGIYGPGRSVLLKKFLANEAVIEADGSRWINQVHRDDIAAALLYLVEADARGIFNVNDDTPMQQRAIYERLARHFDRPLPPAGPMDPNRKRGWSNKRVSNAKLRASGWAPRFTSFFAAVESDPPLGQFLPPRTSLS